MDRQKKFRLALVLICVSLGLAIGDVIQAQTDSDFFMGNSLMLLIAFSLYLLLNSVMDLDTEVLEEVLLRTKIKKEKQSAKNE